MSINIEKGKQTLFEIGKNIVKVLDLLPRSKNYHDS